MTRNILMPEQLNRLRTAGRGCRILNAGSRRRHLAALLTCSLAIFEMGCLEPRKEMRLHEAEKDSGMLLDVSAPQKFVAKWLPTVCAAAPGSPSASGAIQRATTVEIYHSGKSLPVTCNFILASAIYTVDRARFLNIVLHSDELGSKDAGNLAIRICNLLNVEPTRFAEWQELCVRDANAADIFKPINTGRIGDSIVSISIINSFDEIKPWLINIQCYFPAPLENTAPSGEQKSSEN